MPYAIHVTSSLHEGDDAVPQYLIRSGIYGLSVETTPQLRYASWFTTYDAAVAHMRERRVRVSARTMYPVPFEVRGDQTP